MSTEKKFDVTKLETGEVVRCDMSAFGGGEQEGAVLAVQDRSDEQLLKVQMARGALVYVPYNNVLGYAASKTEKA